MTYNERMAQFCENQCVDRKECEYVLCKNTFRCDYLSGIMYGWELGQKDTLEEIEKLIIIGEPWCVIGENIQNTIKELKGK